jgi:hypothetical protein
MLLRGMNRGPVSARARWTRTCSPPIRRNCPRLVFAYVYVFVGVCGCGYARDRARE